MAQISGIPDARIWGDEPPLYMEEKWLSVSQDELEARYAGVMRQEHSYLAISGGGANGAFGAGLLVGWTEAGTRPEFTVVTGISTGALIAPFAFLGPSYDTKLREIYTKYSTRDLIRKHNILTILTGNAVVTTEPLESLLEKYYDNRMMESIAAEHRKGRTLFIGTTDLDAGRPVIWNIGSIAASGDPRALELIHKVIMASSAIPVVFPPVFIEVEASGLRYDEMHVDGGTTSQVFLYPAGLNWRLIAEKLDVRGTPIVYLIRNAFLEPEREAVIPKLSSIAGRSIGSLIRTQGIGDMYRIYVSAKRDGMDYKLAYIPSSFREKPAEIFDPEYMVKLFDLGYGLAKSGYAWDKAPPGFLPPDQSR
jgi:predicted acylesterase/phospholipase RssA